MAEWHPVLRPGDNRLVLVDPDLADPVGLADSAARDKARRVAQEVARAAEQARGLRAASSGSSMARRFGRTIR